MTCWGNQDWDVFGSDGFLSVSAMVDAVLKMQDESGMDPQHMVTKSDLKEARGIQQWMRPGSDASEPLVECKPDALGAKPYTWLRLR